MRYYSETRFIRLFIGILGSIDWSQSSLERADLSLSNCTWLVTSSTPSSSSLSFIIIIIIIVSHQPSKSLIYHCCHRLKLNLRISLDSLIIQSFSAFSLGILIAFRYMVQWIVYIVLIGVIVACIGGTTYLWWVRSFDRPIVSPEPFIFLKFLSLLFVQDGLVSREKIIGLERYIGERKFRRRFEPASIFRLRHRHVGRHGQSLAKITIAVVIPRKYCKGKKYSNFFPVGDHSTDRFSDEKKDSLGDATLSRSGKGSLLDARSTPSTDLCKYILYQFLRVIQIQTVKKMIVSTDVPAHWPEHVRLDLLHAMDRKRRYHL